MIAVCRDDGERGKKMAEKVGASLVKFGYGLHLPFARRWGLYISAGRGATSIGIEEPTLFSEPGVFLVKPDGTPYYGSMQTESGAIRSGRTATLRAIFPAQVSFESRHKAALP